MKLTSKTRALVAILSLTLGFASSALAGGIGWVAGACLSKENAGRDHLECCSTKCAVFNSDDGTFPTDLDTCIAVCMARINLSL